MSGLEDSWILLNHTNITQGTDSRPRSDIHVNKLRQAVKFSYSKSLK